MFGSADALDQAEKDKRNRRRAARKLARFTTRLSFDEWFARLYGTCPPSAGVIRQMKKSYREACVRAEKLARTLRFEADLLCAYRAAQKAWAQAKRSARLQDTQKQQLGPEEMGQ